MGNGSNGKNKTLCDSHTKESRTLSTKGSLKIIGDTFA